MATKKNYGNNRPNQKEPVFERDLHYHLCWLRRKAFLYTRLLEDGVV